MLMMKTSNKSEAERLLINEKQRQWYAKNREKQQERSREYSRKNKDLVREKKREQTKEYYKRKRQDPEWIKRRKVQKRNLHCKHKYGITTDEYNKMLEDQNGVCKICGKEETDKNPQGEVRQLSVDHSHVTGKTRGLLCNKCNRALGYFKDDSVIIENALQYLKNNIE